MSVSELDLETGQRVALVKYGVDGLRSLRSNLTTLLAELDGLKDVATAFELGEHESISHPRVCCTTIHCTMGCYRALHRHTFSALAPPARHATSRQ